MLFFFSEKKKTVSHVYFEKRAGRVPGLVSDVSTRVPRSACTVVCREVQRDVLYDARYGASVSRASNAHLNISRLK